MDALLESIGMIATIAAFAVFLWGSVEGVIEYFIKPIVAWPIEPEERTGVILREISLVIGIVTALLFNLDFLTALALNVGASPIHPLVGTVFSGIFMARGSNWLHDRVADPLRIIELEPTVSNLEITTESPLSLQE